MQIIRERLARRLSALVASLMPMIVAGCSLGQACDDPTYHGRAFDSQATANVVLRSVADRSNAISFEIPRSYVNYTAADENCVEVLGVIFPSQHGGFQKLRPISAR